MHDITSRNPDGLPSTPSLIKATVGALLAALLILVTTMLPAEFGIDPTGMGKLMGLTAMNQVQAEENRVVDLPEKTADTAAGPVQKSATAPRSDTVTFTLPPRQGVEIKSGMQPGDNFVFSWKTDGAGVSFDMHGEPPNAGNTFTSYWLGENQSEANGSFTAPFAGTHGWYWENKTDAPVTITLSTHGFYSGLYMP